MAKKFLAVALLLILLSITPMAYATTPQQGGVIFGEDFTVESGETIEEDVVALGGDVEVKHGGRVEGDLAALGGEVAIVGEVTGSVVAIGGDVRLAATAVVGGDLIVPFGEIERAQGAVVRGQVLQEFTPDFRRPRFGTFHFRDVTTWPGIFFFGFLGNLFQTLFTILALLALGILAVVLVPAPMVRVRNALAAYPAQSLGLGFLSLLGAAIVLVLLVFTCIGIPLAIILGGGLMLAAAFGWVTVGLFVGERLLTATQAKQRSPVFAVAIGTLLISIIAHFPVCLGFIFTLGIASWGLGAVLLTRFGTRPYS